MKRTNMAPILAAALLLANGSTAFAAPEVINAGGVNTVFDAEYYAAANPDVAAVLGTGRDVLAQHYALYGIAEGRAAYAPDTDVNALLAAAPAAPAAPTVPGQTAKMKTKTTVINGETRRYEEYDIYGNLLSETWFSDNGPDTTAYAYTYDERGNILSEVSISSGGYTYTTIYAYTYDAQGNIATKSINHDGSIQNYAYTYDAQGNMLTETEILSDGTSLPTIYTYDAQGNMLTKTYTYYDGRSYTQHTDIYTYDAYGNLLTEAASGYFGQSVTQEYIYTYDAQGNVLTKTYNDYAAEGGAIVTESYDAQGTLLSTATAFDMDYISTSTYAYTYY